jgi:glycerol-3-phosphate dehydrogenase (NAD(P)+)
MSRAGMTVAVLGDGGWGTALALHSHRLGHHVRWWGTFPDYLAVLARRRENIRFLPGIPLPRALPIVPDLAQALASARLVVLAIPSQFLRTVLRRQVRPALQCDSHRQTRGLHRARRRAPAAAECIVVSATKGLERGTHKRMSQVIREELGPVRLAVLSGPNIASEVAAGQPASSVVAAGDRRIAATVQQTLMSERLRLYSSTDVIGVELGGALKNPIAIAAGVGDGLGFGANAKAALISRGIVEMARLGVAMGGWRQTFWGLSGLGDLITTCLSGRNRWLGEQLGRGQPLARILASTPMVIEGVETARAAIALGRRHGVELPIIEQVEAILFRARSPRQALQALMRRSGKPESP